MATLDAGVMLAEISPDNPCGSDVEYDPEFLELELVVNGKPDVQYGETVVAATPPDWKAAEALARSLLSRSHDLRVAGHLARALLHRRGFGGFAESLQLIEGMLEQRWDHVYPQLDPDDDNDPTARVNALAVFTESTAMLADVRDTPLAVSRAHEAVTLREVEYANGELPVPAGTEPRTLSSLEAIVVDVRDDAAATRAALLEALRSTGRIETVLTEHVGAAQAIDLSALAKLLRRAASFIGEHVGSDEPEAGDEAANEASMNGAATGGGPGAAPAVVAITGEVTSRQDVVKAIDRICTYYERHEPSSPVPLLLLRARRLVDMSFMEILQDLAPEGLGQARQVGGIDNE
ncbi:type VI secretion system protein ImpA [Paraburkholderia sp. GAS41]|jgi:type VI secretion system protein ImpA|uniref:type VI secretion system protein TssA n=1 Tax=Paraburkholderia sp. GAS41 TaxID=3035134 RepID=UPI003D246730